MQFLTNDQIKTRHRHRLWVLSITTLVVFSLFAWAIFARAEPSEMSVSELVQYSVFKKLAQAPFGQVPIAPYYSEAVTRECLPFANSKWVLTHTITGLEGTIKDVYFNPPNTCQFVVVYPDGSFENKIILGVTERSRLREERANQALENPTPLK